MPVKVTLELSQGQYSWSEAHYYLPGTTPQSAIAAAIALTVARAGCLGAFSYLNVARLSTVPASRTVDDYVIAGGITGNFKGEGVNNDPFDSEIPNLALLIQISSTSGPAKNLYLAGIPSTIPEVAPNGRGNYSLNDPTTVASIVKYMNFLLGNPAGGQTGLASSWGYRQRNPAGGAQVKAIGNSGGTPSLITLTAATLAGVQPGNEVYLTGFRRLNTRLPGLAGAYSLLDVEPTVPAGPNSVYTLNGTGNVSTLNFFKPGLISALAYQYVPYAGYSIVKIVTRKRGASLGAPRGRSRTRR